MRRPDRNPVDQSARAAAKRVLRRYGQATAALRRGPDYVIVGAKRGGSTSLHNYVLEHPSIQPLFPGRQHIKGVHYYDSNYERGLTWYRSHFPLQARAGTWPARAWRPSSPGTRARTTCSIRWPPSGSPATSLT